MINLIDIPSPIALRPVYNVVINGVPINNLLAPRLLNLSVIDNPGFEADVAQITIDDSDGLFNVPDLNAEMSVAVGYSTTGLIDKGNFIIDAVDFRGPPDRIVLSGKSADFKKKFHEKTSETYTETTLEEILSTIAEKHGYEYKIYDKLGEIEIKSLIQKDESDANLLSRLAREYDAVGTIKKGTLLFFPSGRGKNASGQALPTVVIPKINCSQYTWQHNERDTYTGVRVRYVDPKTGERIEVLEGEDKRTKSLRKVYNDEESALQAARAELKRIKRGSSQFSCTLSLLDPNLLSESPLTFIGFKGFIDGINDYVATRVISDLTPGTGLIGNLEAAVLKYEEE